jgi:hypothetical protein
VAQSVWDETMADTSAHWLDAAGQGARVLIFPGVVAVAVASTLPDRMSRRPSRTATIC